MTKQQQQVIKNILKPNSGKNPMRPALGYGYRSDGATYFSDGCRIVKSTDECSSPEYKILSEEYGAADTLNMLVRFWNDYEQNYTDRTETLSLPSLNELWTSREQFVDVGEYCFTRKYLRDFIKVCKTTTGKIITKYSHWGGKTHAYYVLTGATSDGRTQCILLPVRKPKKAE